MAGGAAEGFGWSILSICIVFFLVTESSFRSQSFNPGFGEAMTADSNFLISGSTAAPSSIQDPGKEGVKQEQQQSSSSFSCGRSCKRFANWLKQISREFIARAQQQNKARPLLHKYFFNSNLTNNFVVVDQDGDGDYSSVQDAIDAVAVNNTEPITIFISPGVYQEKVRIPESKPFITLQGSGSDLTTIVWNDYAGKIGVDGSQLGTFHTATVHVSAPYFNARGITFKNSAPAQPAGSQAVALQVTGDMAAFYECNFIGAQDTLYDHSGRHYFKGCLIQGSVDFIFGNGRSLYKDCELNSIGSGALTAQKRQNASDNTGFSFVNCKVMGNGLVYLGRAWGPFSRVVFIYCYMDSVVNPGGWDDWGDSSRDTTVFYGEFNCTGPGANGQRRVPWSYVLTEAEARPFLDVSFIEGDSWLQYL